MLIPLIVGGIAWATQDEAGDYQAEHGDRQRERNYHRAGPKPADDFAAAG